MSIAEVAKALNVSKTTISFVLNGRAEEKRISAALADKIIEFVKAVGYKANPTAKSLRTGKTNTIGLVIEDITDPLFARIAGLIGQRAFAEGFCVIYSTVKSRADHKNLLALLQDKQADAYIIAPPRHLRAEVIATLISDGCPVVIFDHHLDGVASHYVGIDNRKSAFNATCHLIGQGYDKVVFATFASPQTKISDRIKGYCSAMKSYQLDILLKRIPVAESEEQVAASLMGLFTSAPKLNAILFGSAGLCKIGLKAISRLGLKIPEDIAVATFEDGDFFEFSTPGITAVAEPIAALVDHVFDLLLPAIKYPQIKIFQKITLTANLKVRESSGALKKNGS